MANDKTTTGPEMTPDELRKAELAEIDRAIARLTNFSESSYRSEVFDTLHACFRDVTSRMFDRNLAGEPTRGPKRPWRFTQEQLEEFAEHYFSMAEIIMGGKVVRDDTGLNNMLNSMQRLRKPRLPRMANAACDPQ